MPELDQYECFAADGHWHKGTVHDIKNTERKEAVGHACSLDLRTHTVRHLATSEGFRDHDTSMLKRRTPDIEARGQEGVASHPHLR